MKLKIVNKTVKSSHHQLKQVKHIKMFVTAELLVEPVINTKATT